MQACVNILRIVHAVIEGGGASVSVTRTWRKNFCNSFSRFSSKQASLPL